MEGPEIPGPKVWLDLNRKAEQKVLTFIANNNERSNFLKTFLDHVRVQLGKPCPVTVFAPKTPSAGGRRARRSAISPREPGSYKPVSVKNGKKSRKSSSKKAQSTSSSPSTQNGVSQEKTDRAVADEVPDFEQGEEVIQADDACTEIPKPVDTNESEDGNATVTNGNGEAHADKSLDNDEPMDQEDNDEVATVDEADKSLAYNEPRENIAEADKSLANDEPMDQEDNDVVATVDEADKSLAYDEPRENIAEDDEIHKTTTEALEDVASTDYVPDLDDNADVATEYEAAEEATSKSDTLGDVVGSSQPSGSTIDASFNINDNSNATFDVSTVLPGEASVVSHGLSEPLPLTKTTIVDEDVKEQGDEDVCSIVDATFNITEPVNETFDIASAQPEVVSPEPLTANTIHSDSDADAESEAFIPNPAAKSKSLRKTRTLSLQKKRALHNSTESDSDTITTPVSKNRKMETVPMSKKLTKTVENMKNTLVSSLTMPAGQSSDTGSVRSTRSKRNLPASQESAVSTRVTRSKSRSVSESTSDAASQAPVANLAPPRSSSKAPRRSFKGIRRSSIAASLLKVSAAKGASLAEMLADQEVVLVKPASAETDNTPSPILPQSKSGPSIRISATPSNNLMNNSRAPAGKVIRPGRKVFASGGRGVSPATGPRSGGLRVSVGSQGGMRSRSRMDIINRAGQKTPSGARTPSNMVGKGGVSSFVSKPRGPQLDEIHEQKEMERRKKVEKDEEAKQRRKELIKRKADDQREKREARIKRVQDARKKQDDQKGSKNLEKEKAEKLEALRKREEKSKAEAAKKKLEVELAVRKEKEEKKLEEERAKALEVVKKIAEEKRLAEEKRVSEEKQKEAKRKEAEIFLANEKAAQSLMAKEQLNSTYSKPGDTTVNTTQGISSYDMTPARHELPPEPSKNEENYGLDDLNSDEDTDDEDCPRKVVPKWAEGSQLRTALLKQCYMGPDLDQIFANVEMPDLSSMFSQQRKRFFKRTSSAVWETPPESFKHAVKKR